MYSFFKYFELKDTAFRLLQGLTYKKPGKAKTLQFKAKNSVQFDTITTFKKGKEKENAESIWKQRPPKLLYKRNLKSENRTNKYK